MKKNAIIYIDDTHAQVTKAFEKQARIFGTPEYREWRAYRQDFPNAQMVSKTIKKAKNKRNDAKNRTYEKMAEYICLQENADELMKEFEAEEDFHCSEKPLPRRAELVPCHLSRVDGGRGREHRRRGSRCRSERGIDNGAVRLKCIFQKIKRSLILWNSPVPT